MKFVRILFCGLVLLGSWSQSSARTVELVDASESSAALRDSLAVLAEFYGLAYRHAPLSTPQAALQRLRSSDVAAAVITPRALTQMPKAALLNTLQSRRMPLLIAGVRESDCDALAQWLEIRVQCTTINISHAPEAFKVAKSPVAAQLGGENLMLGLSGTLFDFESSSRIEPIIYRDTKGASSLFLQVAVRGTEMFVLGEILPQPVKGRVSRTVESFGPLAGYAMFIRYAAGDYAWHAPEHQANFTIDDPWLREPYGALSYRRLLEEMEKHNFHTTIAFIPWNFDRSQPEVVALMRDNPKRYSIAIHGNNHDHLFERDARALDEQESDVKQAVARMERFSSLTGLPHDRVMVFPRKIGPSGTLALLKRHNFLATVNARHVPLDEPMPAEPSFFLSAATMRFQNFPSLRRYSVEGEVSRENIAVEAFLGNPLVFYGHQQLFTGGIDNFNHVADLVAKIEPTTRWVGLGEIARHLYKVRQRDDGEFDVLAFSPEITLHNASSKERRFHVVKPENFDPGKFQLLVEDEPYQANYSGQRVSFTVVVPPGKQRTARIQYSDGLNATSQPVDDSSFTATLRRRMSDFRDVTLSQSSWGREILGVYYRRGGTWVLSLILLTLGVVTAGLLGLRRYRVQKAQRKVSRPSIA